MKIKLKSAKDIGVAFFINFLSLFLFWASDALIVSNYDTEFVSDWAFLKSLIFILGSIVTLGIDQSIVRQKLNYRDSLVPVLGQIIILSLILIYCLTFFVSGLTNYYINIFLSLVFYSTCLILFSYQRSYKNYSYSLIILNLWKGFFFIIILFNLIKSVDHIITLSLGVVLIFLPKIILKENLQFTISNKYKKALKTGIFFFLSSLSLNIILFLDQILINVLGDKLASEELFSHITFFIAPFAACLTFVGFLMTPYIRDNREKAFGWLKKYILLFIFFGILFSIVSFYLGSFVFYKFKGEEPIGWLGLILSLILFARYLLVIPSSFFGAFANDVLLKSISFKYNLVNIIYLLGTFTMFYVFNMRIIKALLISLLLTWIMRVLVGFNGIYKIGREEI